MNGGFYSPMLLLVASSQANDRAINPIQFLHSFLSALVKVFAPEHAASLQWHEDGYYSGWLNVLSCNYCLRSTEHRCRAKSRPQVVIGSARLAHNMLRSCRRAATQQLQAQRGGSSSSSRSSFSDGSALTEAIDSQGPTMPPAVLSSSKVATNYEAMRVCVLRAVHQLVRADFVVPSVGCVHDLL
jgi:hypothetical protein